MRVILEFVNRVESLGLWIVMPSAGTPLVPKVSLPLCASRHPERYFLRNDRGSCAAIVGAVAESMPRAGIARVPPGGCGSAVGTAACRRKCGCLVSRGVRQACPIARAPRAGRWETGDVGRPLSIRAASAPLMLPAGHRCTEIATATPSVLWVVQYFAPPSPSLAISPLQTAFVPRLLEVARFSGRGIALVLLLSARIPHSHRGPHVRQHPYSEARP